MHEGRRADGVLTWVAVAVPGVFAGVSWAATEGWPLWNRILIGVAVGVVIYAAIHLAIKGVKGNRR
jgi:hypothetical protein